MQNELLYDEVFDAQQHYRLILDSMARPGKINTIPNVDIQSPTGINNGSALTAFALLNTDVTFWARNDDEITEFIARRTSAGVASLQKADFVFIHGLQSSEFIEKLKTGTLSYPEDSATIVADVKEISNSRVDNSLQLILKGPGVKETATVYVTGLNPAILADIKEQNLEFPLGVDLILIDKENRIICLPRSNDFAYSMVD